MSGMIPRPADAAAQLIDRAATPSSISSTLTALASYRHLLRNLVLKDLKLKYRGSVFGFLWSLANPLLMIVVYTIAFTYMLPMNTPGFVFYLMLGILAWTFFASSLSASTASIADNGGLVKSVFFPRAILPLATVLFNLAQYLLTIVVFLPFMLVYYGVAPVAPMLLFPVFLLLQSLFTVGLALLLSTATAFFRDVKHLVDIGLAVLFWLTPIVYTLDRLSVPVQRAVMFSPMSPYITAYHNIFYDRVWPEPITWGLAVGYAAVALITGLTVIVRYEEQFAERV